MINMLIAWTCAHPLEFVGGLAGLSVAVSLLLIPRLHDLPDHGHPRC